jgi:hypothetical protein
MGLGMCTPGIFTICWIVRGGPASKDTKTLRVA